MVQCRPGFSVRLNHDMFDKGSANPQARRALQHWRPTHAANAQLLVDIDVAEDKSMRAWMDQGLQPTNMTAKTMGKHQVDRMNMHGRSMPEERMQGGAEFQIAAVEVCSPSHTSLRHLLQYLGYLYCLDVFMIHV